MTKPTKWLCAQRRLGSAWPSTQSDQSSLSAWRKFGSLATHWAHSEDWSDWADARLIWVFAGPTVILLVLSCRGSYGVPISPLSTHFMLSCDTYLVHIFGVRIISKRDERVVVQRYRSSVLKIHIKPRLWNKLVNIPSNGPRDNMQTNTFWLKFGGLSLAVTLKIRSSAKPNQLPNVTSMQI